jgi:hypothetical protein
MSLTNLLCAGLYNDPANYDDKDDDEDDDEDGDEDNDFPSIDKLLAFSSKGISIVY